MRTLRRWRHVSRAFAPKARSRPNLVNGTASVTNAQKLALGLNVRAEPSPIPAPSSSPVIEIVSVNGRTVKIKLKATDSARRGKPAGVQGAAVFSYVGTAAPASTSEWKFEGNTNRTTVDVEFPETIPSGSCVWFTAFWFNPRSQSGPGSTPICTNLPGGAPIPMAA
jgi:hypothetical protein